MALEWPFPTSWGSISSSSSRCEGSWEQWDAPVPAPEGMLMDHPPGCPGTRDMLAGTAPAAEGLLADALGRPSPKKNIYFFFLNFFF